MIKLIGMGPGSKKLLTIDAIEAIKGAEQVLAFDRIAQTAEQLGVAVTRIQRVEKIIDHMNCEGTTAILASGDPCFYGILDFLQRKGIVIEEVIPGISSFQYMMAKLKKSWQDAVMLSLHGREEHLHELGKAKTTVVLTDSKYTPSFISQYLKYKGIKGRLYIGYNLSYEDERILEVNIGSEMMDESVLALVVIENEMA